MFIDLFLFFGPLWIVFFSLIIFITEFFSGKKIGFGLFSPPTLLHFVTLSIFLITLISFLNYQYYKSFFSPVFRTHFSRLLLINSFLILIGGVFFVFKRSIRLWTQGFFYLILILTLLYGYYSVMTPYLPPVLPVKSEISTQTPRRLKIIVLQGISLNYILSLPAELKLPNIEWIRNNGIVGRMKTFSPNYEQALLNTILTGYPPAVNSSFTHSRFQFRNVSTEFEIFPRYIFFRNSAKIGLATFYKKHYLVPQDTLICRYHSIGKATLSLLAPPAHLSYSEKNLRKNNEYLQFFPDIPDEGDPKIGILKRAFFLDDYLINRMPSWPSSIYSYFIINLPGLETVTSHFFHYTDPQNFPNLREDLVQKYRPILPRYYQFYDAMVGKLIGTMTDDEMLVIIGLSEIEPLPLWRRILLNYISGKDIFVYRPNSSPGVFFLYEKNALRRGVFLPSISIIDLYPTLCYYIGFQLNRSLSGNVIRDVFTDQFLINNPLITHSDHP